MRLVYNTLLFIGLLFSLPLIFWKMGKYKKYRSTFWEKIGIKLPVISCPRDLKRIWVHTVSLGETKALVPLIQKLQKERPDLLIVFSSTTETGLQEARRSLPHLSSYFLFPLDFSWTIKRLVRRIDPALLILGESDFWYNLLTLVPQVALVNGKLSERSAKRFKWVPFFTKKLFARFKVLCVQSELYKQRFISLGIEPHKIVSTGNLKFDQIIPPINSEIERARLGISPSDLVITLASTHAPEEEELIRALRPLFNQFASLKLLLAPRHPERFPLVAKLLEKTGLSFAHYSDPDVSHKAKHCQIILIDTIGFVGTCYQLSHLAIVGGSFGSKLGGHNIFEPVSVGVPVVFGPYMHAQKDLTDLILSSHVGFQVPIEKLEGLIHTLLSQPLAPIRDSALKFAGTMQGSTQRTWDNIKHLF